MTATLSGFDIFLIIVGACGLTQLFFHALFRYDEWLTGRRW